MMNGPVGAEARSLPGCLGGIYALETYDYLLPKQGSAMASASWLIPLIKRAKPEPVRLLGRPGLCPGLVRTGKPANRSRLLGPRAEKEQDLRIGTDGSLEETRLQARPGSPGKKTNPVSVVKLPVPRCDTGGYRNINARPHGWPLHVISAMSIVGAWVRDMYIRSMSRKDMRKSDGRLTVRNPHPTRTSSSEQVGAGIGWLCRPAP